MIKTSVLSFVLLFVFSCKTDCSQKIKISGADFIGKWNQVNNGETITSSESRVDFFQIVNDSIVDVHIVDSNGKKKIRGKWERDFVKNVGSTHFEIKSDIVITYRKPGNPLNILTLALEEENGKTILLAHNYRFEKE